MPTQGLTTDRAGGGGTNIPRGSLDRSQTYNTCTSSKSDKTDPLNPIYTNEATQLPHGVLFRQVLSAQILDKHPKRPGLEEVIAVDVPLPSSVLSDTVIEMWGKLKEILRSENIMDHVEEVRVTEEELTVQVHRSKSIKLSVLCQTFLHKEVKAEVPYYLPRGINFKILTGKVEVARDPNNMEKALEDSKDLLNYLDRKTQCIFDIPVAGEDENGKLMPSSLTPFGGIPTISILEDIRSRIPRLKVRIFPDQRRVLFIGNVDQISSAKRDLDETLAKFRCNVLRLESSIADAVSSVGKKVFPNLQWRHHLVGAKANVEEGKLTISGSELAVKEATDRAEKLLGELQNKRAAEKAVAEKEAAAKAAAEAKPGELTAVALGKLGPAKMTPQQKVANWADMTDDSADDFDNPLRRPKSPVKQKLKPPVKVEEHYLLPQLKKACTQRG